MKHYPSIEHAAKKPLRDPNQMSYAFVKYDGSNLRFEWSKKQGWYKFGSRNVLIDESTEILGSATDLFLQKYGDGLEAVFKTNKLYRNCDSAIVFAEWFGAKTFAGMHVPDDPKDIVLFDVNPYKKGILGPREFLDNFGHLSVAELLYQGELSDEFIESVKSGEFEIRSQYSVEIPEGVLCKGGSGHQLWMRKIKTDAWRDELKIRKPTDWTKYW